VRRCEREGVAWPRLFGDGVDARQREPGSWLDASDALRCRELTGSPVGAELLRYTHPVVMARLHEPVALPSDAGGAP